MTKIVSFGYKQPDGAPEAHLTFDLRELFRDPHVSPEMRELTGVDPRVIRSVMSQAGAEAFLQGIVDAVLALRGHDVIVAFGCVGGRHRSVVFADALYAELLARLRRAPRLRWTTLVVEHRDIDKPVLARTVKP